MDEILWIIGMMEKRKIIEKERSERMLIMVWSGRNGIEGNVVKVSLNRLEKWKL